jgi:hypothetical protein
MPPKKYQLQNNAQNRKMCSYGLDRTPATIRRKPYPGNPMIIVMMKITHNV